MISLFDRHDHNMNSTVFASTALNLATAYSESMIIIPCFRNEPGIFHQNIEEEERFS